MRLSSREKGVAMALMGLDVGTSGVKCTIADDRGAVIAEAYRPYETLMPQAGYFELNANEIWEKTKATMKEALAATSEKVYAVAASSFGEAFTTVDKDQNVLTNFMTMTDIRGTEEMERLRDRISDEQITEKTSLKPALTYSLSKLMWLHEEAPEIYRRVDKMLPGGAFITYRLTGGVASADYALSARTLCFNVHTKDWDNDIIEAAGLDRSIFPDLVPMGTVVGEMDPQLAQELGLSYHDIKVVIGTHDQIAAGIGGAVDEPGMACNGTGTVDCILPIYRAGDVDIARNASHNYPLVPYMNDLSTTYAYIFDGGALIAWYKDVLGSSERHAAEVTGQSVYDILDHEAPSEPTRLLFLPHLSGAALPYMDPFSKGAVLGLDRNTDKGTLFRGMCEGQAYELKVNLDLMEEGGIHVNALRATGGGSVSDLRMQIKADVWNRPIEVMKIKNAGTLGLIIMGGVACGIFKDYHEAMHAMNQPLKTFHPDPKNVAFYAEQYEKYRKVYQMQKEILAEEA